MARHQVEKTLQLVNGIYRKVTKHIEHHQEKQKQRVTEPRKPFGMQKITTFREMEIRQHGSL